MRKPSDKETARDKGELAKLNGMNAAARSKQRLIAQEKLALLDAMVKSPTLLATSDDTVNDLLAKYPDGGKWRGSAFRGLATEGIIQANGTVKSNRSARHRGFITLWAGRDRIVCEHERKRLKQWLLDNPEPPNGDQDSDPSLVPVPTSPKKPTPLAATNGAVNELPLSQGNSNNA